MGNSANEKVKAFLEAIEERKRNAEEEYESAVREIQRLAERNIDIFGNDAVGRVAEIATKVRRANDKLFAECQALVLMIDQECRPLIKENLSPATVEAIVDMIEELNEGSEIKTTFNASFQGYDMGNVAESNYVPSIECNMIQTFWKTTYEMMPGVAEEKAQKQKQAEENRKSFAEKAKRENADKEKKYEDEKAAYSEWKEKASAIEKTIKETVEAQVAAIRKKLQDEIKAERNRIVNESDRVIAEQKKRKGLAERALKTLGLFKFAEKKEQKSVIAEAQRRIDEALKQSQQAEGKYVAAMAELDKKIAVRRRGITAQVQKENPIPKEPVRPKKPYISTLPSSPTVGQIINDGIKNEIYDFMQPGKMYTVDEMRETIPSCSDLTQQRILEYVKQLVSAGMLERTEKNGKAYYGISEKYV